MSKQTELCDAIVAALNADTNDWSVQFKAYRRSAPITTKELETLHTLDVAVYTGAVRAERRTRKAVGGFARVYKPVIGLCRKLAKGDEASKLAAVTQLDGLQEEMEALLEPLNFTVQGEQLAFMAFDEEQDREKYGADLLQAFDVYASAIVLEYWN